MWKFNAVLLLLALPPAVNSKEIPIPRMCAVCLEKDCANGVRIIYPAGSNTAPWLKANSPTGIQNCSMENLKPDSPCKMANGSFVLQANKTPHFEGIDTYGVRRPFDSQISPCADLNLPPSSTPSPAPIHYTPTPAAQKDSVADEKGSGIGIGIGIILILILILILIGVLIWKRNSHGQGQDGDHRHGNSRVPPHDAEDRDENATKINLLNKEVANENGEIDSVVTAGSLGHCNESPV